MASKRVLLIDDDETFRYVMRQIVSSESRYEFIEAVGGDVGLKAAREQKPDVIILDLQMPTMDGFTVLQELGADSRTSVTPIIVSTSLNVNAELKARLPARNAADLQECDLARKRLPVPARCDRGVAMSAADQSFSTSTIRTSPRYVKTPRSQGGRFRGDGSAHRRRSAQAR